MRLSIDITAQDLAEGLLGSYDTWNVRALIIALARSLRKDYAGTNDFDDFLAELAKEST